MANLRNGIPLPGTRTVEYCAGGGVGDILKGSSNPELGDTPAVNSVPPGEGTACVPLKDHYCRTRSAPLLRGCLALGRKGREWRRQGVTLEQEAGVGM